MTKVGGILKIMVLWQAVFLAASPLARDGSAAKSHSTATQYRQLRRLPAASKICRVLDLKLPFVNMKLQIGLHGGPEETEVHFRFAFSLSTIEGKTMA